MTEFPFKKKDWVHSIVIEAENEQKADEIYKELFGEKDEI